MNYRFFSTLMLALIALASVAQNNVAEEVAWVIGDEPIFKSDIEEQYQQALYERVAIDGNPYCVIPEQMALDKLFLDQARIDTVEVSPSAISAEVESKINFFIANLQDTRADLNVINDAHIWVDHCLKNIGGNWFVDIRWNDFIIAVFISRG